MGLKYLLDTNICIYIANEKPEQVRHHFEKTAFGEVAMSMITYGELLYGAHKSHSHQKAVQKLKEIVALIPALPLPNEAAEHYGKIRNVLEKKGKIIGGNDLWIASHALSLGVTLITNNEKEFKRISELKIENWC